MSLLKKMKIDKTKDLDLQIQLINKNFQDLVEEKILKDLITKTSSHFPIPYQVVEFETKQFMSSKFDYGNGKFKNLFIGKKIFSSALTFILKLFYIIFFSKITKDKNYYDVIIDDITINELKVSKAIVEKFDSHLLIGNQKLSTRLNYISIKLVLKKFFKILKLFFYFLRVSIIKKVNLIPIFSHVSLRYLKYQSYFESYSAKYLINTRPIIKSSIRNYLFKKSGGKVTASIQKSLNGLGYADSFYDTDILFSTGARSFLENKNLNCKIKKIVPVGSLALEQFWHKEKKIKSYQFDIVNLAGNSTNTPDILKHYEYDTDYYEQFDWMVKIAKKFPKLSIGIKHHKSLRVDDQKEINIINGTSIKRVINDTSDGVNKSYNIGYYSNFACTWCSMIAYELLSLNKPCFFLDPNGRNNSFFQNDNINDFWRIKSYQEFENKISEIVLDKKKIKIEKSDNFCLESNNVSTDICETLKKTRI